MNCIAYSAKETAPRLVQMLGVGVACLWLTACGAGGPPGSEWPELKAEIRERFPDVRQLSTKEFHDWVANTNRVQPLLLDCRASEEFETSHLQGAALFDGQFDHPDKTVPIVVYCSVGYRSSVAAKAVMVEAICCSPSATDPGTAGRAMARFWMLEISRCSLVTVDNSLS